MNRAEMPEEDRESQLVRASRLAAVGLGFGFSIAAGVIVGYYLDAWAGTAPLLTLLFTLGALAGALYRLVWTLRRYQ